MTADFCLMCGTSHPVDKTCPPWAYHYFKCKSCSRAHFLPRDAVFGLEGMHCGCGELADKWDSISHEDYQELVRKE